MKRINPYKRFDGAWVPNWLLEREEVSAQAKLLYARLAQYAGKKGYAWPTQETLAHATGLPGRTLQRHLQELEGYGLVEIERRGLNLPNVYYFLEHEWMGLNDAPIPDAPEWPIKIRQFGVSRSAKLAYQDAPPVAYPIKEEENHRKESVEETPPLSPSQGEGHITKKNPRKQKSTSATPGGWKRLPQDWFPSEELIAAMKADCHHVDLTWQFKRLRDYEFRKVHYDPVATFRTWMRNEEEHWQEKNPHLLEQEGLGIEPMAVGSPSPCTHGKCQGKGYCRYARQVQEEPAVDVEFPTN